MALVDKFGLSVAKGAAIAAPLFIVAKSKVKI